MGVPTTFKFGAGLFYLGDGATPEVISKICGFTAMELQITKDMNDAAVPDCDNPDAPIWKTADVTSQGWSMKFEGFAAKASLPMIETATFASNTRGVRLYLKDAGVGAGTPDHLYEGRAHVTMSLSGKVGEKWQVSVEITGDGALTSTSATIPVA